ncbi:uncharacterized protein CANTADRAFT_25220 [Suhomyces tanzawaensis NRRL Y-17324]|uniref:NEDD8-activating enzyme E1 regulatory subunit n=1 Tax=Suhomyces tanzawaensis NRRL Y-17324 TaxID=984487 RepID=A0A1E4SN47_9ASCO|nr:uncharacterized protein CANTADRAFT_25220 [Suhomyces tanzawaensis NRRL Y-17324]ODV80847.1 hypothetical protein CANTADRAFT_25220 [Suhomyces tanzawaensis NRRL Y-17324]
MIDKETKYDRQLRLWASTGQANLENSHICLINASATGSEILKNLVLPGIGEFTIIDDKVVSPQDLSGNFFLKRENLGQDIATSITSNLSELNTDVKGHAINQSIKHLITKVESLFWDQFNVVIVSDYSPELDVVKDLLWDKRIPLLIVNSVGFYGSLNLIANEVTVIETHDPSRLYDLRIDCPWPELQEHADSIDLNSLSDQDHAHVPYIIIYIKVLQAWKQEHNNLPPQNYGEKKLFRLLIESYSRNIKIEANFTEASNSIHRALQVTQIPNSISKLFENSNIKDENLSLTTPIFWIYIKALKNFVHLNNNQLPLPGNLPDMASDTAGYIKLQNIYRAKALKDQELFTHEVQKILDSIGRSHDDVNTESIASFCKNSQLLYVSQGSKELYGTSLLQELLHSEQASENYNALGVYFSILTYNAYIEKFNSKPSIQDLETFSDLFFQKFSIDKAEVLPESILNTFKEVLSHNTQNYHNLNSLMGGIVSQEVLKLATSQYTPLDNLFVFDGIRSFSEKWKI